VADIQNTVPTAVTPPSGRALAAREFWANFSRNRGAVTAGVIVLLLVFVAIFAPVIAPHSPIEQYRDYVKIPPAWLDGGNWKFILGTDEAGRDMLSRLMYGARLSFWIGFVSVVLALIPGVVLGLIAAFFEKWADTPIMRIMDVLLALPSLLLAVAVVAIIGPGLFNTMFAIAIVALPGYVRLSRASALGELQKEYVTASRVAGGAAQLHGTAHRAGNARFFLGDSRCGCARFPRPRRTAAGGGVGRDARVGTRLYRQRVVDRDVAGPRYRDLGAGDQPARRRAT
jgi:dipeptide transport system permease protein